MTARALAGNGLRSSEFSGDDLLLVLDNSFDAIEAGRRQLATFFERHALDPATVNRLEVIFEELTSNALRHGFAPGSDQSVHVRAAVTPGAVELLFEDDGTPFNPLAHIRPDAPRSLDEARPGGLGIALVLELSSALRYERLPQPTRREPGQETRFQPTNRVVVTVSSPG